MKYEFDHGILYHGDCLDIMPGLPDKSVDMILADLPYGITQCKWDTMIPISPLFEQYKRIIKNGSAIVLTASQPFTTLLVYSNLDIFRYEWIWEKTKASGHLDANKRPLRNHEEVLIFGHLALKYNPQGLLKGSFKNGRVANMTGKVYGQYNYKPISENGNYPKTILKIPNPSQAGHLHPTQKPVELFEYLIKTYTNEGETVLDNVMGSGTTAVAAFRTGRRWIGIEKDPEIYEMCLRRIQCDTQQMTIWTQNNVLQRTPERR